MAKYLSVLTAHRWRMDTVQHVTSRALYSCNTGCNVEYFPCLLPQYNKVSIFKTFFLFWSVWAKNLEIFLQQRTRTEQVHIYYAAHCLMTRQKTLHEQERRPDRQNINFELYTHRIRCALPDDAGDYIDIVEEINLNRPVFSKKNRLFFGQY